MKNSMNLLLVMLLVMLGTSCAGNNREEEDKTNAIIYYDSHVTHIQSPPDYDLFARLDVWDTYYRGFAIANDCSLLLFRDTEIGDIEVVHVYSRTSFGEDWGSGYYLIDPEFYTTKMTLPDGGGNIWIDIVESSGNYTISSAIRITDASFSAEALTAFPNNVWPGMWDSPTGGNELHFDGLLLLEKAVTKNFSVGVTEEKGDSYVLHNTWNVSLSLEDVMMEFLQWDNIHVDYVLGALEVKGSLFVFFEHASGIAVLELDVSELRAFGQDPPDDFIL